MKEVTVPDEICKTPEALGVIFYKNESVVDRCRVNFTQYVFSFLLEGRKEIYASNGFLELGKNDFALVGIASCLMTEKRSPLTDAYHSILFTFSQQILDDFKFKYRTLIATLPQGPHRNVLKFPHDQFTQHFIESLRILQPSQNPALLAVKLEELLLYLLDLHPTLLQAFLSAPEQNRETEFRRIIENNISSNLGLEELAFLCNRSTSTFKRHFTKIYQSTPQKWLTRKRLELAKHWIQEGRLPKEMYTELGYKSLSNFIRAYKKHHGVSTREHRNELL